MMDGMSRAIAVGSFLLAHTAWSATITVDDSGGAMFASLQAAINASVNGDIIEVAPGEYAESLSLGGRTITIRGVGGATGVVVRSPSGGRLLEIADGQGPGLRFEGLTFTGGSSVRLIRVNGSSPVFERCIFRDNTRGALDEVHGCGATTGGTYRRCLFLNNREPNGGAVYFSRSNCVVEDCAFVGNQATGPTSGVNAGGSVYVNDWECGTHTFRFTRCHFVGNSAVWGGAIYSQGTFPNAPTQMPVTLCVFIDNSASQGRSMWNWYITAPVSGSSFCGGPDQIRNWWQDAGGNSFSNSCGASPYPDCDGDRISDALEIALGYSADCNANELPDACEITSGQGSDANGDGVLDGCDEVLSVPSEYPTIQAAIDAVARGSSARIEVAAGVHAGGFSLGGKDVVVEGDAKGGTVIDGAGLAIPAIRFAGGEPATAGVRGLVVRDAQGGETLGGERFGAGLFARDSAAFVVGCRFENCASDYGAGAAFFDSTIEVRDCMFIGNTAMVHAGGLAAFRSRGTVSSSNFELNRCGFMLGSGAALYIEDASGDLSVSGCFIVANSAAISGAALEVVRNGDAPGIVRIAATLVEANSGGNSAPLVGVDAGGLRIFSEGLACVLAEATRICGNAPRDVDGAYLVEATPGLPAVEVCDPVGDIVENGFVDGEDMAALLGAWGASDGVSLADLDHDGVVSGADLALLLNAWGAVPGATGKE